MQIEPRFFPPDYEKHLKDIACIPEIIIHITLLYLQPAIEPFDINQAYTGAKVVEFEGKDKQKYKWIGICMWIVPEQDEDHYVQFFTCGHYTKGPVQTLLRYLWLYPDLIHAFLLGICMYQKHSHFSELIHKRYSKEELDMHKLRLIQLFYSIVHPPASACFFHNCNGESQPNPHWNHDIIPVINYVWGCGRKVSKLSPHLLRKETLELMSLSMMYSYDQKFQSMLTTLILASKSTNTIAWRDISNYLRSLTPPSIIPSWNSSVITVINEISGVHIE